MFTIRPNRRTALLAAAAVGIVAALLATVPNAAGAAPTVSAPTGQGDSQDPSGRKAEAAHADGHAAPYLCRLYEQILPAEQRYRTTDNQQGIYLEAKVGLDWFDVKCGNVTFTVPPGKEALVDLTAVAELDCGHNEAPVSVGWCGGRFLINGLPLPDPDNTGLEDSYAWDSSTGGGYDYQAHTLAQVYKADCTASTTGNPCYFRVQLQSRLEAGSKSIWIDDLTMRVDVNVGPVKITP